MKNLIRVFFAVLLIITICFSSVGCKKSDNDTSSINSSDIETGTKDYITLLYSSADGFNPYAVKTDINHQLCKLIYEPLIKLDNNFNVVYCLAKDIKTEEKKCTVILNNASFSDGSKVTASDVAYSCNLAMKSQKGYASQLYEVEDISVQGNETIIFQLKKHDPYFLNLLNFPILKEGSEKIADSDSVMQPPIGSGKYKVSKDKTYLEKNKHYYGEQGNINNIRLINAPDKDSVSHYVEIGATDLYYNEGSNEEIIRMSGEKVSLNLNNIVYLGVNQKNPLLANKNIRQAISSAINRNKICNDAFYGNAISANGFYNPNWKIINSVQNIEIIANKEITIENLQKIGYNKVNGNGVRTNSNGTPLNFTLLVNSENRIRVNAAQLIANQLKECGIRITIVEKSFEKYKESLKNGEFQLYLAEVKLTDNMDLSPVVCAGGSLAYGIADTNVKENEHQTDKKEQLKDEIESVSSSNIVKGFYEGKYTLNDTAQVLQDQMPIIPICYRTGVLFHSSSIKNVKGASVSDIFFSINSYIDE